MGQEYKKDVNVVSAVNFNTEPFLFDNFEGSYVWNTVSATNASATAGLTTSNPYSGNNALELNTGATTPTFQDEITVHRLAVIGANRYLEFVTFFNISISSLYPILVLNPKIYRISKSLNPGIHIDLNQFHLFYVDSNGTPQKITDFPVWVFYSSWLYLKFVIDLKTDTYVSLQFGDKVVDLSGIAIQTLSINNASYIDYNLSLSTTENMYSIVTIDNIVMRNLDHL